MGHPRIYAFEGLSSKPKKIWMADRFSMFPLEMLPQESLNGNAKYCALLE